MFFVLLLAATCTSCCCLLQQLRLQLSVGPCRFITDTKARVNRLETVISNISLAKLIERIMQVTCAACITRRVHALCT